MEYASYSEREEKAMENKELLEIEKGKIGRRIVCYIVKETGQYRVCTGKPSDATCLSWTYDELNEARRTFTELLKNYKEVRRI